MALVAVLATAGGAGAAVSPPGDFAPSWSPDGARLAFQTLRTPPGLAVVNVDGSAEGRLFGDEHEGVVLSPDWSRVAYAADPGLWVSGLSADAVAEEVARCDCGRPSWSPDSKRIASPRAGGGIVVVDAEVGGLVTITAAGYAPTWSPDGARVAYLVRAPSRGKVDLHVVRPDGSDDVNVSAEVSDSAWEPSWSPDGSRLAFWSRAWPNVDLNVAALDGTRRTYRISDPLGDLPSTPNWSPDGDTIAYSQYRSLVHAPALHLLDLKGGTVARLPATGMDPVFSPDGSQIAFADGGECRDRYGIYVVEPDGKGRRRVTNDCRVVGTPRGDRLHGSFSQVVLGLAGNDRLYADDPAGPEQGNTLDGGPGDDRLYGGRAEDTLDGGAGADALFGGASGDVLIGGPGRDRIEGQGGGDVVRAVDGRRDSIGCGAGRDLVYADRSDVVATDCEVVRRT